MKSEKSRHFFRQPNFFFEGHPIMCSPAKRLPAVADDVRGSCRNPTPDAPLADPQAAWDRPAITTYGEGYFSARDERYRYVRYPDGREELYDHQADAGGHENLAGNPVLKPVKERQAGWIPGKWAKSLGGRLG